MELRRLIIVLFAFWLAVGPAASAWAQSAGQPCDSMSMSAPVDDCCAEGMNQAKCLSACLAACPAVASAAAPVGAASAAATLIVTLSFQHASILAPPDSAPPKLLVS